MGIIQRILNHEKFGETKETEACKSCELLSVTLFGGISIYSLFLRQKGVLSRLMAFPLSFGKWNKLNLF